MRRVLHTGLHIMEEKDLCKEDSSWEASLRIKPPWQCINLAYIKQCLVNVRHDNFNCVCMTGSA